ncbi:hypothetical protein AgCh_015122 [Apium graveolens]
MDENKKPPVGQGLNKAAEITLFNIKCVDKAGNQHINGPKVDKYRKKLMKKAAEQGAEFVSYDPVQGEWKRPQITITRSVNCHRTQQNSLAVIFVPNLHRVY